MKLKYGKEEIQLPIEDKNIIKILNLEKQKVLLNPENKLRELLKNPIGCSSLRELIFQKKAKKILIIVNDITGPTPYEIILPPLENISQALNYVKDKYGEDFQAYILPSGNVVLPQLT